jgi:hypothetical protein
MTQTFYGPVKEIRARVRRFERGRKASALLRLVIVDCVRDLEVAPNARAAA